jgi:hypothetical protein
MMLILARFAAKNLTLTSISSRVASSLVNCGTTSWRRSGWWCSPRSLIVGRNVVEGEKHLAECVHAVLFSMSTQVYYFFSPPNEKGVNDLIVEKKYQGRT